MALHTDSAPCGWVDEFGRDCGIPASTDQRITLTDRLVKGKVIVCPKHKAQHNRMAAELRASLSPKRNGRHS